MTTWDTTRRNFKKTKERWDGRFMCEQCGLICEYVEVDHDKLRSTNPELIHDFSNLRIVCPPCHRKKHNQ